MGLKMLWYQTSWLQSKKIAELENKSNSRCRLKFEKDWIDFTTLAKKYPKTSRLVLEIWKRYDFT
jgi:hypothetical protein